MKNADKNAAGVITVEIRIPSIFGLLVLAALTIAIQ